LKSLNAEIFSAGPAEKAAAVLSACFHLVKKVAAVLSACFHLTA
jgi:hypothetical protein